MSKRRKTVRLKIESVDAMEYKNDKKKYTYRKPKFSLWHNLLWFLMA